MLWLGNHANSRRLVTALLILCLAPIPLPVPDYHDLGHRHGEGQVCTDHEHLLRWHPDDVPSDEGAVLHWHWVTFLLGTPDPATSADGPVDPTGSPDPLAFALGGGPQFTPAVAMRPRLKVARLVGLLLPPGAVASSSVALTGPAPTARGFGSTYGPRTSRASLFQRWDC
jgi:hypothetical protein